MTVDTTMTITGEEVATLCPGCTHAARRVAAIYPGVELAPHACPCCGRVDDLSRFIDAPLLELLQT